MKVKFKNGHHRPRFPYWLRWWPLLIRPEKIVRKVYFDAESKYDLHGPDQHDNNKLFGIGFPFPHKNSARFGWRYEPLINKFVLSAYCYRNGERYMEDSCDVVANHWYQCEIWLLGSQYVFRVINDSAIVVTATAIDKNHKMKSGWLLGPYFGGNRLAPRDIIIQLKKP